MYLPLLKFTEGTVNDIYSIAVTKDFKIKEL
jgi:hypothetical protein